MEKGGGVGMANCLIRIFARCNCSFVLVSSTNVSNSSLFTLVSSTITSMRNLFMCSSLSIDCILSVLMWVGDEAVFFLFL